MGRVSPLPSRAIWLVEALIDGDPRGNAWRGRPAEEHRAAALRHLAKGAAMDRSGYDHRVHVIARLLMELDVEIAKEGA